MCNPNFWLYPLSLFLTTFHNFKDDVTKKNSNKFSSITLFAFTI